MRKTLCSALVLVALVFSIHQAHARLVGTNPGTDVFCAGGSPSTATNEVCIDATGNVIPTTTGVSSLGTSALKFKDLFVSGSLTIPAGSIDSTKIASSAVTLAKLATGAVDSTKIVSGSIDTSKITKTSAGAGALCEMNDGTGKFGHCTNASAVTCTCL